MQKFKGYADQENVKLIFSGMEMKSRRLEISADDFRQAFADEPLSVFNQTFDQNYEPVARKIAYGEYYRFWSRHGIKKTILQTRFLVEKYIPDVKFQRRKYSSNDNRRKPAFGELSENGRNEFEINSRNKPGNHR